MAFKRIGYGKVEPNQLSAQKTGQIYASLPLDESVEILQNGEFMYYDYATGKVTANPKNTVGEPMLVFNEIKIYEEKLALKDFAMIRVGDNYVTNNAAIGRITSANTDGTIYGDGALTQGAEISVTYEDADGNEVTVDGHTEYGYRMNGIAPRLFKTNIGDIMTTNMVADDDYDLGDILVPTKVENTGADGVKKYDTLVLTKGAAGTGMAWQVAKVYTMPDGQPGLKLQRIQ